MSLLAEHASTPSPDIDALEAYVAAHGQRLAWFINPVNGRLVQAVRALGPSLEQSHLEAGDLIVLAPEGAIEHHKSTSFKFLYIRCDRTGNNGQIPSSENIDCAEGLRFMARALDDSDCFAHFADTLQLKIIETEKATAFQDSGKNRRGLFSVVREAFLSSAEEIKRDCKNSFIRSLQQNLTSGDFPAKGNQATLEVCVDALPALIQTPEVDALLKQLPRTAQIQLIEDWASLGHAVYNKRETKPVLRGLGQIITAQRPDLTLPVHEALKADPFSVRPTPLRLGIAPAR